MCLCNALKEESSYVKAGSNGKGLALLFHVRKENIESLTIFCGETHDIGDMKWNESFTFLENLNFLRI